MKYFVVIICCVFTDDLCAKFFPENVSPEHQLTFQAGFLSLEQAGGDYERRLVVNMLWCGGRWGGVDLIGKLHIAPDYGSDTAETAVFGSFTSIGGLLEYSWVKWFRFFINTGPSLIYQKVTYQFKTSKESFSDFGAAIELNLGLDYAISDRVFVNYSLGRRFRNEEMRIDKAQSLGLKFSF